MLRSTLTSLCMTLALSLGACGVQSHPTDSNEPDSDADRPRGSDDDESSDDDEGSSEDASGTIIPAGDDGATVGSDDGDGDDDADDPIELDPDRPLSYWADTKVIIDAKCAPCHVDGGIAPMALTAYDEVEPYVDLIEVSVRDEVMPPWTANIPFDYVIGDRRLSPEHKEIMLSWLAQGAPEGDPDDEPEVALDTTPRRLERVDTKLDIPEPYTPQIEPDDYRCFVIEWPHDSTKYVTGIDIVPDKRSMVHHAIVYHVEPENAASARDRDAAEEGPGYTCFGGAGGTAAWLQSYEPGGYAQKVPGDLGFEIRPGSVMILQVHYNTLHGLEADGSWLEFTLEDSVPQVGKVVLIMNPLWLAGSMPIPAGNPDVPFSYRGRSASLAADRAYGIYWVDLHMHQLGKSGRIGIIRADRPNELEILLDVPKWDFAWQETYLLKERNVLNPGDQLYVECHFDNTQENQGVVNGEQLPPRDVNWGDGTTDEMCLGNVLAAPL
jgi:hypothetical protein